MSDHRQIMNKAAFTAILALTISLVFCTACVSTKKTAEREVSAADETTAGAVPDNKGSSRAEGKGQNGSERTAGEEILEKAGKTAADTAARAVTGKNTTADEDEKEEDEAQQSIPDDHMEKQENSQEQIWESEDSENDDREEKEEDDAFEESGDDPEEEEHENSHVHDWVEQTEIIHHDETGHFEDEADSVDEIGSHMDSHYDPQLGYIDASYSVQEVVTDVIRHPESSHEEPVFEKQWIVDSEAWDETVVTGYRCSTCGAVK